VSHAVVLGPDEGERVSERATIKGGRPEIVVTEFRYGPGDEGPDLHVHRHHADAFWVLEGSIAVGLGPGGDEVELPAGAFVLVPPEVVHTFRNPGPGPGRYLNLHAPGMGFDDYMRGGAGFDQEEPPDDGGRPASEAIVRAPREGETLELGASRACVKAGLDALAVVEITVAPDFPRPPAHRHLRTVEVLYVLEGEVALQLGDERATVAAGGCAFLPAGTVHTSLPSAGPVRFVNLLAPGGLLGYLREVARSGSRPDPAGYDIELV
jgi:mannose-6-phosphate isomerase-like protein (cupin superfamily)